MDVIFTNCVSRWGDGGLVCVFIYFNNFPKEQKWPLGQHNKLSLYKNQDTIIRNTLNILILTAPCGPYMTTVKISLNHLKITLASEEHGAVLWPVCQPRL